MATRNHQKTKSQKSELSYTNATTISHTTQPQNTLIALQRIVGNQAVNRMIDAGQLAPIKQNASRYQLLQRAEASGVDDLSDDQAKDVQSRTAEMAPNLNLKSLFDPKMTLHATTPHPEVRFKGTIATELQHGLSNTANQLATATLNSLSTGKETKYLSKNITTSLALDLTPFKGAHDVYRFTFITEGKGDKAKNVFMVENLGSAGTGIDDKAVKEQEKRFATYNFTFANKWSDEEKKSVYEALSKMPNSFLDTIKGIKFERGGQTTGTEGGHYDQEKHTIVVYDKLFTDKTSRFGTSGEGFLGSSTYALIHEIGHALDYAPMREAEKKRDTAIANLDAEFGQYKTENADGTVSYSGFPASKQKRFDTLFKKATDAQKAYDATTTDSAKKAYKDAQGSNKQVSEYGETDTDESFAEAFALYMSSPKLLQKTRPKLYEYFKTNLPKK